MREALILIDYTYDFVADDGKLTAGKPTQAIREAITRITKEAYKAGSYIFFVIDSHDEGDDFHPEAKLSPPHNIKGTSGHDLYDQLADLYAEIKEDSRVFWLDKRHYSAFLGTDLDIRLRERRVTIVILTSALADIYVLHIAIDAYNLGYDIEIPMEAAASLTEENHQFALNHLKNVLGARIVQKFGRSGRLFLFFMLKRLKIWCNFEDCIVI